MKWMKRLCSAALTAVLTVSLASTALAADYSFNTDAPQDYYGEIGRASCRERVCMFV